MRSRWQFSLRQLFVWVALVAAFFSLRACLRSTAGGAMAVGLGIFAYLAVRRAVARASPGETLPDAAARQQAARPKVSWPWRAVALLAALAGLWVLGVQLYMALVEPNARARGLPGLLLFLSWGTGGMAVGVAAAALVRLWMGRSLGRSFGCVFGLALGWLTGLTAIIVFGVDILEDYAWILLVSVHEGLVVGIVASVLLPRYSHRAARWSAVAASAAIGAVLLVALLNVGGTLFQSGYLHLRHLILALAGSCFAGLGGGIVGAVAGAVRDRRRLALPRAALPDAPPLPEGSPFAGAPSPRQRRPWRVRNVRAILVKSLLGFLLVCACLAIVDLRSEPSVVRAGWDVLTEGVDALGDTLGESGLVYTTNQTVERRQTVELPPVDKVEVFLLDDRRGTASPGFPARLFPMGAQFDPRDEYMPILSQATLTGPDAEALAQLWRSGANPRWASSPPFTPSSPLLRCAYGLRFYAHGCLILEVGNDYLTDGGLAYQWHLFLGADEPLAVRLQEILPLPDEDLAQLAIDRGSQYLGAKQYDKAEAEFRRALQLRKDDPEACLGLARVLEGRGLLREALAAYDNLLASDTSPYHTQSAGVYDFRARIHYALGNYEQAIADLTRAVEYGGARSADSNPYLLRAAAYLELKEPHAAMADLDFLAQVDPEDPEVPRLRAKVYRAMGKPAEAEKELQKAAELAKQRQSDSGSGNQ